MEVKRIVLVLCVVYTVHLSLVYGCSCMWGTHNQRHFCDSDFAIKAEVKSVRSEKTDFGYVLYHHFTMNVFKVYKEHPNVTIGQEVVIRTGGDGAMCGVYLKENVTYFIAGYVYDDILEMNSCGWIDSFDSLTKSQVRGIEHDYSENCACAEDIQLGMVMHAGPPTSCSYGPGNPFGIECYYSNGYCAKKGPNKCSWVVDERAKPCQKRIKIQKLPKLIRMKYED